MCDVAIAGITITGGRMDDCVSDGSSAGSPADPSSPNYTDPCPVPPGGFLAQVDGYDYGTDGWSEVDPAQFQCCMKFSVPYVTSSFVLLSRLVRGGARGREFP